jgi:hypothetical protein
VYERPWLDWVLPFTFAGCGLLFLAHVQIDPEGQGAHWHLAMGLLLIAGGLLEGIRVWWRRGSLLTIGLLPLVAFAFALIAIPVAAAS